MARWVECEGEAMKCKYGDRFCPCQDGDICHYEGDNPWPKPKAYRDGEARISSEAKPYVIKAKIFNNRLLSAILSKYPNVNQFCIANKLSPTQVGKLLAMKKAAWRRDDWTLAVQRISVALRVPADKLFDEDQRYASLVSNQVSVELTTKQALGLAFTPASLGDGMKQLEHENLLAQLLSKAKLTEKEALVIQERATGVTLDQLADDLDLCRERIRQIESKAYWKLRKAAAVTGITSLVYADNGI